MPPDVEGDDRRLDHEVARCGSDRRLFDFLGGRDVANLAPPDTVSPPPHRNTPFADGAEQNFMRIQTTPSKSNGDRENEVGAPGALDAIWPLVFRVLILSPLTPSPPCGLGERGFG